MDEPAPRPANHDPARPPAGRHWQAFAVRGPVLVVSGVLLHLLANTGIGLFLVAVGACGGLTHLYPRYRGLDVVIHNGHEIWPL